MVRRNEFEERITQPSHEVKMLLLYNNTIQYPPLLSQALSTRKAAWNIVKYKLSTPYMPCRGFGNGYRQLEKELSKSEDVVLGQLHCANS